MFRGHVNKRNTLVHWQHAALTTSTKQPNVDVSSIPITDL
jgi:hypothetical protein